MNSLELTRSFLDLVEIVSELRQKCPWDRKQTMESLRHLTIEETFELSEAILDKDAQEIRKELGDLLLHILFYARLGEEASDFDLITIIQSLSQKLIRRHPHIYGDLQATTAQEVTANWEEIKAQEKAELAKKENTKAGSTLDGVPKHLPSLIQSQRMQEKAASVGFDWENKHEVWEKIQEEIVEFEQAQSTEEKKAEMGDILFSLVNYCRFVGINADEALQLTNRKFKERFMFIEQRAKEENTSLKELSLEEMEMLWKQAKNRALTK